MKKFWKKVKAFTITELVIVIAVIAILAAVLVPTFSGVINSSNKSADKQYVNNLNKSLNATSLLNGTPSDYEELMLTLAADGMCDSSNPFMLAKNLKQADAYLIWYPNTNSVIMITAENDDYNVIFTPELSAMGNGVIVTDKLGNTSELGYALLHTAMPGGQYMAKLYKDYYVTNGGDVEAFMNQYKGVNIAQNLANVGANKAWSAAISKSINNQISGYSYSNTIANAIKDKAESSSSINIFNIADEKVTEAYETITSPSADKHSEAYQAAEEVISSNIKKSLATIATLSNVTETADTLAGKTISLGENSTALVGVSVDMSEVTLTPIGTMHRDAVVNSSAESASFDFCGVTFENYTVDAFVTTGAQYQTGSDNGYEGGAYNFNYGLFGTVIGEAGTNPENTVHISNLTVKNPKLNLNNVSQTVDGTKYDVITDSAGIIAGYTRGSVEFSNIVIDGGEITGANISGYDSVAPIVGRCQGMTDETHGSGKELPANLSFVNCHVSDILISGMRKAGGFAGTVYRGINNINIENCSLKNVKVVSERTTKDESFAGAIIAMISVPSYLSAEGVQITINGLEFENVTSKTVRKSGVFTDYSLKLDTGDGNYLSLIQSNTYKTNVNVSNFTVNGEAVAASKIVGKTNYTIVG